MPALTFGQIPHPDIAEADRLTRVEVNIEAIKDSLTEIKQALRNRSEDRR